MTSGARWEATQGKGTVFRQGAKSEWLVVGLGRLGALLGHICLVGQPLRVRLVWRLGWLERTG
jgi:hypothetical protein